MTQTILITGASLGIGKETAFQFAREGHRLFLTYNEHEKEGKKVAEECLKMGAKSAELVHLNLMDDQTIQKLYKKISRIDWLINNAGIFINKPFLAHSKKEIEMQLRTNLEGTIKLTQSCLPKISKGIINVASAAGKEAYENMSAYCASKFGLRGFTQSLALEHPELKIYCVNPGYTATRMTHFQGIHPREVGKIIFDTTKGKYKIENGGDIDVEEILGE